MVRTKESSPDTPVKDQLKDQPVKDQPVVSTPSEAPTSQADIAVNGVSQSDGVDNSTTDKMDPDQIDDVFKELKTLLGTVEKLQKARQDVGDIKPLILRLLDGELLSGDELEQLKSGVNGLSKLVKLYSDYQTALDKAQPARDLLDHVLK